MLTILLSDLRYRKIYNHQVLVLLLSLLAGGNWAGEIGFYYFIIVLFVGTLPLALRFVGGGDIKLISCFSLTINPDYMMFFILMVPVLGVVLYPMIRLTEWVFNRNNMTTNNKGIPLSFAIITSFLIVQKLGV